MREKILKEGINDATLDIGLKSSIRGSKIFAVLKGAVDAGLNIPHNDIILPADERIKGRTFAAYAKNLSDET